MFVLMISRLSSNMGHIGSETRSLGQIEANLVNTVEATFFAKADCNLVKMFIYMISRPSSNMGQAGSKGH